MVISFNKLVKEQSTNKIILKVNLNSKLNQCLSFYIYFYTFYNAKIVKAVFL